MKVTRMASALMLLVVLLAAPAGADVYIEQYNSHTGSSQSSGAASGLTKMWIADNAIRIEEADGGVVHITDLTTSRLITLDTAKREYFVIPLEQVRQDLGRASARLKEQMQISWRIDRIGEESIVSGFVCMPIVFRGQGRLLQGSGYKPLDITIEFWVSKETPVSYGVFQRMMDAIGIAQNPFMDSEILSQLRDLGGYPVQTITSIKLDTIDDRIEQTVRDIQEIAHDPSLFAIPAGYSEADAPAQTQ